MHGSAGLTSGIGHFFYNFSDNLQSALNPLLDIHDERGAEVFCTGLRVRIVF